MLAVDPAFRGQGVGAALVEWCVARARESGRARLVLHTTDPMRDAQRLYARLGFDRAPDLDWEAQPGSWLRGYRMELGPPADPAADKSVAAAVKDDASANVGRAAALEHEPHPQKDEDGNEFHASDNAWPMPTDAQSRTKTG